MSNKLYYLTKKKNLWYTASGSDNSSEIQYKSSHSELFRKSMPQLRGSTSAEYYLFQLDLSRNGLPSTDFPFMIWLPKCDIYFPNLLRPNSEWVQWVQKPTSGNSRNRNATTGAFWTHRTTRVGTQKYIQNVIKWKSLFLISFSRKFANLAALGA